MGFLSRLFKPKTVKQFEHALKNSQYDEALSLCRSDQIPVSAQAEAQYKALIHKAVSEGRLDDPFQDEMRQVAAALKNKAVLRTLPDPEQIMVQLAFVANVLKNKTLEEAFEIATQIKDKEGQTQALRTIVGNMACKGRPLEELLQVVNSIPSAAHANEEFRNLLLAKILQAEFDAARQILPHISQEIRRGLRPQIDFVERNLDNLDLAQRRARDLVHPDDIALTLALVAGAMGKFGWMSQFSRSVSRELLVGTHTTYAFSLAYAGKLFEAISLLENIQTDGHEYYLRLSNLAINFPLSGREADIVTDAFTTADHYQGALAFWHHRIISHLVGQDIESACDAIGSITNENLRKALAALVAEFSYAVKCAMKPS